jgi:protein gp37
LSWAKHVQTPGTERVFTCSWSDWFLPEADAWRDEAWDIIRQTPQLTYLILTKRPQLAWERLPKDWGRGGWPNVWLGVSIENQTAANVRLPILLSLPAQHRFVSCEPLLGPVSLIGALREFDDHSKAECLFGMTDRQKQWRALEHGLHWVIAGGESGRAARPCDAEWVRMLRDECHPNIPFYFKQWGEWLPFDQQPAEGEPMPDPEFAYCKMGKKASGYLLDGQVVQQWPRVFGQVTASSSATHQPMAARSTGEGSSS